MKFKITLFLCLLNIYIGYSQAILNTESILKEIDSTLVFNFNIEGDVKIGNVDLIQFNNSILIGKKINNSVLTKTIRIH